MRSITRPRPETVHAASVMTRAAQERALLPVLLFLLLACLSILPARVTAETSPSSDALSATQPPLPTPASANENPATAGTPPTNASTTAPAARHRLLFVATHNVPRGKFHHLEQLAAPHGLAVEGR